MKRVKEIEITHESLTKIAKWKADRTLCDLIMSKPTQLSISETEQWYENNHKDPYQEIKGIYLDSTLVGIARLMFISKTDSTGEIGLYIGSDTCRGAGLGKLAVTELIRIANEVWSLNKVYARIRSNNEASIRLFTGLGFIEEGKLKNHYRSIENQQWDDVLYFSNFLR